MRRHEHVVDRTCTGVKLFAMPDVWAAADLEPLVQPLWDYLAVSDPPRRADVIFVFGCRDFSVPARAAQLHHEGHASHILTTGSYGLMTRDVFEQPEAFVFRDHLVAAGVPEAAIVTEPVATNTLENVRFGLAALAARGLSPRSVLLVAKGFVMRRCVATCAEQWDGVRVDACPPAGGLREAIDRHPTAFAARLVAELDRLDRYAAQGDIRRQRIPPEVRAAADRVRDALRDVTPSRAITL